MVKVLSKVPAPHRDPDHQQTLTSWCYYISHPSQKFHTKNHAQVFIMQQRAMHAESSIVLPILSICLSVHLMLNVSIVSK